MKWSRSQECRINQKEMRWSEEMAGAYGSAIWERIRPSPPGPFMILNTNKIPGGAVAQ